MKTPVIAASMLSADFAHLKEEAQAMETAGVQALHWDIMDGAFVPALTFGPRVIQDVRPHCSLPFEAHLMVENPRSLLGPLHQAGVERITVHGENDPHLYGTLAMIRDLGIKAGVALNPSTSVESIGWCLPVLDHILVMTVNPGAGGQSFLPAMLEKISFLHDLVKKHDIIIQVDGGVNAETAPQVIKAGAGWLVAGSALFKKPYETAVNSLRTSFS